MADEPQLSDVQLAFLRVLWDLGEGSVAAVQAGLRAAGRDLAPTTVSTVLSRLEKRGLVAHQAQGRQYLYRALLSEQEVRRSMVSRVTEHLFGGDVTALVSHLLGAEPLADDELAEIQALLASRSGGVATDEVDDD